MAVVFYALCVTTLILLVLYLLSTWKFNYWKKRNVPHLPPVPIFGNYKDYMLMRELIGKVADNICKAFPKAPYVGAYYGTEPALLIKDPELVKLIMTKDFPYFYGREITEYTHREVATRNMFFDSGDHWKVSRQNMSPLFTAAKIRGMFPLIKQCTKTLERMFERQIPDKSGAVVNVQELVARFTMDCICSCGFGVESKTMENNSNNPFMNIGKAIFENSLYRGFSLVARSIWPHIFYNTGLTVFPSKINDFFTSVLLNVYESRNYEPSKRNDFVDMLLQLKKKEYITSNKVAPHGDDESDLVTMKIDNEFLLAQSIVFFAAGYETSSTITSFTLVELSKDLESQQKVYEEIEECLRLHNGELEYECVNKMPFLEACVDETLRIYPVLSLLTREVMQKYTLPDGLVLEKGSRVHLPVYHLHHNPENFPDPETFRPERFLPENKHKIKPYSYIPFGEGPRICIGMRLGKVQMMAGLATILRKYRVEWPEGAPKQMTFDATAFVTNPKNGFQLKFIPRQ